MSTPLVILTEIDSRWALTVDGVVVADIPGGGANAWRVRRDAFTVLADNHNLLVVWQDRRHPELGYVGVPFTRDPCDPCCPLGPRGHATVLLLGQTDDTCTNFARAQRALDLANEAVARARQARDHAREQTDRARGLRQQRQTGAQS